VTEIERKYRYQVSKDGYVTMAISEDDRAPSFDASVVNFSRGGSLK
jgi:hypothetical protein